MNAVTYRPTPRAAWRPALRGRRPLQMGQASVNGAVAVLAPILVLGVAGGATYFGLRAGLSGSGAAQWFGWLVGLAGAVVVLGTIADLFYMSGQPRSGLAPSQTAQQQATSPGTVPAA